MTISPRELLTFSAYRSLSRLYFHMPILVPFLLPMAGGAAGAMLVLAVYAAGTAWATGSGMSVALSRRIGVKRVVIVAELLKAAGLAVIALDPGLLLVVAGQLAGGIGFGLGIGTDSMLLRARHAPEDAAGLRESESRSMSVVFPSVVISGVLGSLLYVLDPRLPFALGSMAPIAAALCIASIPGSTASSSPTPNQPRPQRDQTPTALRFHRWNYVVTRATIMTLFLGVFPFVFGRIAGLGVAWYGVILAAFSLTAFLSARMYPAIAVRLSSDEETARGRIAVLVSISTLVSASLIAVASVPPALGPAWIIPVVAAVALLGVPAGLIRPLALAAVRAAPLEPTDAHRVIAGKEARFGYLNAGMLVTVGSAVEFGSLAAALAVLCIGLLSLTAWALARNLTPSRRDHSLTTKGRNHYSCRPTTSEPRIGPASTP